MKKVLYVIVFVWTGASLVYAGPKGVKAQGKCAGGGGWFTCLVDESKPYAVSGGNGKSGDPCGTDQVKSGPDGEPLPCGGWSTAGDYKE